MITNVTGMLQTKVFEVRDRGTFVVAVATRLSAIAVQSEKVRYLLARSGFGKAPEDQARYVLLYVPHSMRGERATYDPFEWGDRTFRTAHQHVIDHWDELTSGQVVDVEYILGETKEPKRSESEV